ncbi:MAG: lipopolysaccharide biosynthesis protein [Lentimicrobiaceae bacterium]|nr:lipopolysaccharide biosynthesis protein [Lentimicrobiaceae bacterium]
MAEENLKAKTLSGMIWSFVQRFGTMAISFVSNIILARLLTPDDYGTIGMLMIFIAVANTFVDGGFGSALIQKKEPTKEDYSTIFWWNMLLSVVLYGLLFLGAPAVARFYNLPILCDVLRVQGIVLIINALSIIQQNQLRKQLKFKRLASVTVVSAVLSASIAIVLAYMGWGVWALVAQQLMLSGFTAIQLWVLNKWWPSIIFSTKSFKDLFGFGGFMLISGLINTLCNNIQGLLIGRFCSPATLGYYTQARKLEEIASTSFVTVVDQVSYPILAKFQDDKTKLISILKKLILSIAFVTFPLMIILIIISHPLILFLYSEKWLASVPYFRILCFAGIAICLQGIHYHAVASIGKSKAMFYWTIVKRTLGIIYLIVGLYYWDIYGLLWACVAGSWTILIINAYLTSKYVRYDLKEQFMDLLPIILLSIVSYIISEMTLYFIDVDVILKSFIRGGIFSISYIVIAHMLKIEAYTQIKSLLFEYVKKK